MAQLSLGRDGNVLDRDTAAVESPGVCAGRGEEEEGADAAVPAGDSGLGRGRLGGKPPGGGSLQWDRVALCIRSAGAGAPSAPGVVLAGWGSPADPMAWGGGRDRAVGRSPTGGERRPPAAAAAPQAPGTGRAPGPRPARGFGPVPRHPASSRLQPGRAAPGWRGRPGPARPRCMRGAGRGSAAGPSWRRPVARGKMAAPTPWSRSPFPPSPADSATRRRPGETEAAVCP